MGIIRKNKTYWLDIRIKGKRIRRSLHTTKRLEALYRFKEKRDELVAEYGTGNKTRFSKFSKQYLDWAWTTKPKVALKEEQRLERIKEFFKQQGIIYLEDITPHHAEKLKSELRAKRLKKSTVNGWLQILRCMFYKAIDWEVYSKPNPMKKVQFYRKEGRVRPLSGQEIEGVLKEARRISDTPFSPIQSCFYDVVILALNTGLRRSELLNLRWRDVNGYELDIKGKGEKYRTVPLNTEARKAIDRQPQRTEFVFDVPNRNNATVLQKTTQHVSDAIGRPFHIHLLRHAFATSLLERGVDLVTIGAILGHSTVSMSLIYSHTDSDKMKKAVNLLE